eukprot:4454816-Pyramimonas_sp.AAC.1
MLKYCERAAKRRAWPKWGIPVELAWMILGPTTRLEHPGQLSRQIEERRIRAADKRKDEEDLSKHTSLHKYRVGRRILERMGWRGGTKLGRSEEPLDGAMLIHNE